MRYKEVVMEREEILVLEEGMDDAIGPMALCCFVMYGMFSR
jgi:hypothetical protein